MPFRATGGSAARARHNLSERQRTFSAPRLPRFTFMLPPTLPVHPSACQRHDRVSPWHNLPTPPTPPPSRLFVDLLPTAPFPRSRITAEERRRHFYRHSLFTARSQRASPLPFLSPLSPHPLSDVPLALYIYIYTCIHIYALVSLSVPRFSISRHRYTCVR